MTCSFPATPRRVVLCLLLGLVFSSACGGGPRIDLVQEVDNAITSLESTRGLSLVGEVPIRMISEEDYLRQGYGAFDGPDDRLDEWFQTQRALGFTVPPGYADQFAAAQVPAGLYRPEFGDIVLIKDHVDALSAAEEGGDPEPILLRHVLVHELTHAAGDQEYGLWFGSPRAGASSAWLALVEGDAEWVASQSAVPPAPDDEPAAGPALLPLDSITSSSPYALGIGFVASLVDRFELAGLDAAYSSPPVSMLEVVWPSRYDPTVARDPSDAGTDGALGVLAWAALLDEHGSPEEIWSLLERLRFDGLASVEAPTADESCVDLLLEFDGEDGLADLISPIQRWSDDRGADLTTDGATVAVTDVCTSHPSTRAEDPLLARRILATAVVVQAVDHLSPACPTRYAAGAAARAQTNPSGHWFPEAVDLALRQCSTD